MVKRKTGIILSLIFIMVLCSAVSLAGCNKKNESDSSSSGSDSSRENPDITISLNVTSLELQKYETAVITATASDNSDVLFSSDNETVASVTQEGIVTAKNAGVCNISAIAGNANVKCKVMVSESPYSASIKGVTEEIRIVNGGEFKMQLYADFNGSKLDEKIKYSVAITENAAEGVATAQVKENDLLIVKGEKAGITSFSVFAEIRGMLAERTFTVIVYANEIVIEPKHDADFERIEGAYKLTLVTKNGEMGYKDSVDLGFAVQVNGNKQEDAIIEFDINADYNADFDNSKVDIIGDAENGYTVKAKARGRTVLVGKYVIGNENVFVKVNLEVILPEKELTDKLLLGKENGVFTAPSGIEGSLEEITLSGITVSVSTDGNKAFLNKELIPDGGNEKCLADMVIYTDEYKYNATAEICTKILTEATDFDAFKMAEGDYKAFTGYYVLTHDIDFADYGLCTARMDEDIPYNTGTGFKGVLDGNGHKMKNLTLGKGGIFGHIGSGAVIKNIVFDNVYYTNRSRVALLASTIRDADLIDITVNVSRYDVQEEESTPTGSWVIKYDVGLLSSRFLMESRLKNVSINAAGHTIINIFGHRCSSNEFVGVNITAKSYKLIGCNSDNANPETEIKSLPSGVTFTTK